MLAVFRRPALLTGGQRRHGVPMQKYGLGGTALQVAVDKGKSVELVQLLLERGAEVDTKDKVRLLMWRDVRLTRTLCDVARNRASRP